MKLVRIETEYPPFVKYVPYEQVVNEARGELIEEALAQMKVTGRDYAIVKCPCCDRMIRITIQEVEG